MSGAVGEEIRAALDRLRRAGRALRGRPARQTLDALGSLLETWRDPNAATRRVWLDAYLEATGFSSAMVETGMTRALAGWTGAALDALVERELGGCEALEGRAARVADGFEVTALLMAGSVPSATLLSLLSPLVLRSPVLVKPSAHDPVTPAHVAESIAAVDPLLGACIEVARFPGADRERVDALLEADCVVASGSDATIADVADRVRPPRRMVGYGHRLSVAAVGSDRRDDAAARLAQDVALWDQLGCLSPLAVFVEGDCATAAGFGEALATALAGLQERWPRSPIGPGEAAAIARERDEAEMRAAGGAPVRVLQGAGTSWTVLLEADARMRPAPLHRFVRVHPVAGIDALLTALEPIRSHLAAVGVDGFSGREAQVASALARLGASRICPLGTMQAPPLAWCRDNRGVLLPLARLSDNEL